MGAWKHPDTSPTLRQPPEHHSVTTARAAVLEAARAAVEFAPSVRARRAVAPLAAALRTYDRRKDAGQ